MTYTQLLESTSPPDLVTDTGLPPGLDEIEIQSRWFAGHFPRDFRDNHGKTVVIIDPGEWNRGAGPDFLSATVQIDGETHHGPIELDLEARNWELHGHRDSHHFNEVILHVVLHDSGPEFFTRTHNNREIPRILLSQDDVQKALGLPRLSQALARPGRCLAPLADLPQSDVTDLLKEAALHRARLKAHRFEQTVSLHGFQQALWENLAEALGFSANRLPMRLLAQRLPLKKLLKLPPPDRAAIIFGTAGFLAPNLHESAPPDSREWLEDLWTLWWKHRVEFEFPENRVPAWSTRNTRPGNHPQRRLAALAAATEHWKSLVILAKQSPPFTGFSKALLKLTHPFWDQHHTLLSKKTERPLKLIGKSRLEEFLINALYPLHLDDPTAFFRLRASAPNQKVKRCSERLFGSLTKAKPHLSYAWQHQALLQIYQDFCLEDLTDCQQCPFPEQLSKWTSHD